ncbi:MULTISPECIES: flagellar motor protein MotB [Novosphingobium]|uniref:OmpA family protein n=1 Tax=Novosphingobium mangrovi (ex Hu et al. 2023) TaxID=2930094 RepID=A0ABT0AGD6_9SPHN|nr:MULTISPECIES: flagellar motor protein MotB [Novosphingobium]MCJ1962239.1 OmpA family protein [Novosphingobium mangrovi (ex Hu et al. 2023)]MED5544390.1 flagellar motor protein MotB [Pseudomonadota bacterium]GAM03401.1 chemotaxis protein MotB [Novosphingobium sp. MBES04]
MAKKKEEPLAPIIVKKVTVVEGGHHGGAWKVAYADFVTAMMAFFLLLWILGATTEKQRKGIADYFTPTLVQTRKQSAGSAGGLLGGSSLTDADNYPHAMGQTGTKALTIPRGPEGGPKEGGSKVKRTTRAKESLEAKLRSSERLRRLAKQVRLVDTTQGVRIDLVDDADFAMFRLGTTVLTPDASELLGAIAQAVGPNAAQLTIRGHTDALPFLPGTKGNNWSLSAGRAEATRQALLRDGLPEDRFRRIEGVADKELLIPGDPNDPRNRRISITLLD